MSEDVEQFRGLVKNGKTFMAVGNQEVVEKLSPGVYEGMIDYQSGTIYFRSTESTHDELIDIPSSEFNTIVSEMQHFLKGSTKESFEKYGFVYKRSALLHGKPGTGKTCIVNRVIQEVVNSGGIVLINPNPEECEHYFSVIDSLQPETTTLVVFEEFENSFNNRGVSTRMTSLLDGETQKENVMYLATTNHIEQIPNKILRPGRFSTVIEVGSPSAEGRKFFLESKLGTNDSTITEIVEKTDGFTIDELKEVVLATKCLGKTIDQVCDRLRTNLGK